MGDDTVVLAGADGVDVAAALPDPPPPPPHDAQIATMRHAIVAKAVPRRAVARACTSRRWSKRCMCVSRAA
ncbi:hypothetical protein JCM10599A_56480 [Paraburkholderia kururiensis]